MMRNRLTEEFNDRDKKALEGILPKGISHVPKDYNEMKRKEKEANKKDLNKVSQELLLRSIEFYEEYYPHSELGLVWNAEKVSINVGNELLDMELNQLTEDELFGIQAIYDYCHDERFIVTIDDHSKMDYVLAKIKKLIPGSKEKAELKRLLNEESLLQKQKRELQEKVERAQTKHQTKIDKQQEKKNAPPIFKCDICGKVCKSKVGLGQHSKVHEREENEEYMHEL
jgi:hypothetical protein